MIPIHLTVHAFGPFAGETEIDFTLLRSRRIFLVCGETGAGKTTIFDAVTFALYGNASGEGRKSYTLKSHHAAETDLCWVRFRFALRGEEYEIYRQPLQPGRKRDGSPKELGEKAELTLPDSQVTAGAAAVNRRIGEILGLSYSQFKQTIMLAQGEFRRLLEASSSQKQEIFSKIFGTEEYQALTDALSARQVELGRQAQSVQEAIARGVGELGRLGFPALGDEGAEFLALEAVSAAVEEGLSLHRAQLEQLDGEIEGLEKEKAGIHLEQARELNGKLERFAALKEAVAELEAGSGEMDVLAGRLKNLQAARELREQEAIILTTKKAMEEGRARLKELERQAEAQERALERAAEEYRLLPQRKRRAEQCAAQLAALREREKQSAARAALVRSLAEREAQLAAQEESLTALEQAGEYLDRRSKIQALERAEALLRDLQADLRRLEALSEQRDRQAAEHARLYRAFLDGQAASLAEGLAPGTPCPVCGALDHPSPAAAKGALIGEKAVNNAKETLDNTLSQIVSCNVELQKKHDLLAGIPLAGLPAHPAADDLPALMDRAALQGAEWAAQNSALLERHPALPLSMTGEEVVLALSDTRAAVAAGREGTATLREALAQGEDAPPLDALQSQIKELTAQAEALNRDIDRAEKDHLAARSLHDRIAAELDATRTHWEKTDVQFRTLQSRFVARLQASGFADHPSYRAAAEGLEEAQDLEARLETHRKTLSGAKAALEVLTPDVEGRAMVDLEQLEARWNHLTRRLIALRDDKTNLFALITAATGRMEELHRLFQESGALAKQYAAAADLAALAKGSKGPGISFERYILASYFEDIIQIANIHLQRMTGSRYRLQRQADKSRRGSSGLDMEVIDSYTGTRRSVSTLSGGEGFKASLALALGLSDVVQIYAGGVSIDTMFIDEGFGSLDEKSLDSAVQTLLSLETGGRMVGVISHVPQLRDAIAAKLLVRYSPTGSTVVFDGVE